MTPSPRPPFLARRRKRPQRPRPRRPIAQAQLEGRVEDPPVERPWHEAHRVAQRLRRRRGGRGEQLGEGGDDAALPHARLVFGLIARKGGGSGCRLELRVRTRAIERVG
eukprot:scaffold9716_cov70-Phaeocystis_antarctica.AAC.2